MKGFEKKKCTFFDFLSRKQVRVKHFVSLISECLSNFSQSKNKVYDGMIIYSNIAFRF